MYSMVALLIIPATVCFVRAYALDTPGRPAVDRGLRGLRGRRALHAQLADLLHRRGRRRLGAAVEAGRGPAAARAAARRPARLRRRVRALPAVGADDALPGRPHRRAVVRRARVRLAARRARRAAGPDAADRAADLRRRRPAGLPAAAALASAAGWPIVLVDPRRAHARAGLDPVAGLARLGQPLPRRRAAAVPAARRRRARERAPARRRRPAAGRDHVGPGRRAGGEEQRARRRARDRAEPRAGRPRDLHPARDDPGAATTTCRTACATRR